ncbi:hypothetical protein OSTOST_03344 [Ostertagia ostertagi]
MNQCCFFDNTVAGEQRLPPMLEGGEYKLPFLSNGEEIRDTTSESIASTSTVNSNSPAAANRLLCKIRQMDVPLSLAYGIFVRLMMTRWSTFNIFLPWFLLFFSTRFVSFVRDGTHFLNDMKTTLQSQNLTAVEGLIKRSRTFLFLLIPIYVHFLQLFTSSRLIVMVAAFLVTHSIVIFMHGT